MLLESLIRDADETLRFIESSGNRSALNFVLEQYKKSVTHLLSVSENLVWEQFRDTAESLNDRDVEGIVEKSVKPLFMGNASFNGRQVLYSGDSKHVVCAVNILGPKNISISKHSALAVSLLGRRAFYGQGEFGVDIQAGTKVEKTDFIRQFQEGSADWFNLSKVVTMSKFKMQYTCNGVPIGGFDSPSPIRPFFDRNCGWSYYTYDSAYGQMEYENNVGDEEIMLRCFKAMKTGLFKPRSLILKEEVKVVKCPEIFVKEKIVKELLSDWTYHNYYNSKTTGGAKFMNALSSLLFSGMGDLGLRFKEAWMAVEVWYRVLIIACAVSSIPIPLRFLKTLPSRELIFSGDVSSSSSGKRVPFQKISQGLKVIDQLESFHIAPEQARKMMTGNSNPLYLKMKKMNEKLKKIVHESNDNNNNMNNNNNCIPLIIQRTGAQEEECEGEEEGEDGWTGTGTSFSPFPGNQETGVRIVKARILFKEKILKETEKLLIVALRNARMEEVERFEGKIEKLIEEIEMMKSSIFGK